MAWWLKYFLCKYEDWNLDPQKSMERLDEFGGPPVIPTSEGRGERSLNLFTSSSHLCLFILQTQVSLPQHYLLLERLAHTFLQIYLISYLSKFEMSHVKPYSIISNADLLSSRTEDRGLGRHQGKGVYRERKKALRQESRDRDVQIYGDCFDM